MLLGYALLGLPLVATFEQPQLHGFELVLRDEALPIQFCQVLEVLYFC